jgi:hypothetical protein
MNNRIFISWSGEDRPWVKDFAAALRLQGNEVWLDEQQLKPGDPIEPAIENGLRSSDTVAFVLTPESARRRNVLFELGAAIGMKKRIVPIVDKDMAVSDLPFPLRIRYALTKESPEETARKFLAEPAPESAAR